MWQNSRRTRQFVGALVLAIVREREKERERERDL